MHKLPTIPREDGRGDDVLVSRSLEVPETGEEHFSLDIRKHYSTTLRLSCLSQIKLVENLVSIFSNGKNEKRYGRRQKDIYEYMGRAIQSTHIAVLRSSREGIMSTRKTTRSETTRSEINRCASRLSLSLVISTQQLCGTEELVGSH